MQWEDISKLSYYDHFSYYVFSHFTEKKQAYSRCTKRSCWISSVTFYTHTKNVQSAMKKMILTQVRYSFSTTINHLSLWQLQDCKRRYHLTTEVQYLPRKGWRKRCPCADPSWDFMRHPPTPLPCHCLCVGLENNVLTHSLMWMYWLEIKNDPWQRCFGKEFFQTNFNLYSGQVYVCLENHPLPSQAEHHWTDWFWNLGRNYDACLLGAWWKSVMLL